jgi:hypothetical protein
MISRSKRRRKRVLFQSRDLFVTKAIRLVIVDDANGLKIRIDDRRADETEAALPEIF